MGSGLKAFSYRVHLQETYYFVLTLTFTQPHSALRALAPILSIGTPMGFGVWDNLETPP